MAVDPAPTRTILVVDDEVPIRLALTRVLGEGAVARAGARRAPRGPAQGVPGGSSGARARGDAARRGRAARRIERPTLLQLIAAIIAAGVAAPAASCRLQEQVSSPWAICNRHSGQAANPPRISMIRTGTARA